MDWSPPPPADSLRAGTAGAWSISVETGELDFSVLILLPLLFYSDSIWALNMFVFFCFIRCHYTEDSLLPSLARVLNNWLWPKERVNKPQSLRAGSNYQWNKSLGQEPQTSLDASLHLEVPIHRLRKLNIIIPTLVFYSSWVKNTSWAFPMGLMNRWPTQTPVCHMMKTISVIPPPVEDELDIPRSCNPITLCQKTQKCIHLPSCPSLHSVIPSLE